MKTTNLRPPCVVVVDVVDFRVVVVVADVRRLSVVVDTVTANNRDYDARQVNVTLSKFARILCRFNTDHRNHTD